MRRKNQMNWPLRLVPMPTSTTTPHKVPPKVLPPATLSGQKGGEGGEEEEEEVSEAPATSPAWTSSEALTMETQSATPSSPMASSSSSAPEASHQFVVQPEELVRWLDDGQIRRRLRLFEVRDRNSFPTTPAALPPAKVLLLSSLSHNGVPVHPLQFQHQTPGMLKKIHGQ
uniref:Uncharacterized protein n=1 Tax=Globodera rostochiensis TaxID=31243 RepID=A0A914HI76_GLORO